jgi:hypothetical protein
MLRGKEESRQEETKEVTRRILCSDISAPATFFPQSKKPTFL